MRTCLLLVSCALSLTGCSGDDPGLEASLEDLASTQVSIEDLDICEVVKTVPDLNDRVSELTGGHNPSWTSDGSQSEHDISRECSIISDGEETLLQFAVTQSSDSATEDDVSDEVLHGGCRMEGRTYDAGTVLTRCAPDLRVYVAADVNNPDVVPPSSGDLGTVDPRYRELVNDLLRALDS